MCGRVAGMADFIDFATLQRPSSPNTYLVAPDGLCQNAVPDRISPVFPHSARGLFSVLNERIAAQRRWVDLVADPERLRLKFIAKTKWLGFKDDIDIMVIAADAQAGDGETGARMAIYSRSRVGYSDLGANRKRVDSFIESLITIKAH